MISIKIFYGIRLVDSTDACMCNIIWLRLRNLCIICINFINRITSISDLCIWVFETYLILICQTDNLVARHEVATLMVKIRTMVRSKMKVLASRFSSAKSALVTSISKLMLQWRGYRFKTLNYWLNFSIL